MKPSNTPKKRSSEGRNQLKATINDPSTHIIGEFVLNRDELRSIETEHVKLITCNQRLDIPPYSDVYFFPIFSYDSHSYYICKHKHLTLEEAKRCALRKGVKEDELSIIEIRSKWVSIAVAAVKHKMDGQSSIDHEVDGYEDKRTTRYENGAWRSPKKIRKLADRSRAKYEQWMALLASKGGKHVS